MSVNTSFNFTPTSTIDKKSSIDNLDTTFIWTITSFSSYNITKVLQILSPTFTVTCDNQITVDLSLYCNNITEPSLSLKINFLQSALPIYPLKLTLSMLTNNDDKFCISTLFVEQQHQYNGDIQDFIYIDYIKNKSNNLLHNDALKILCNIEFMNNETVVSSRNLVNLNSFFENEQFSDVTIVLKSKTKIPAHKIILAAHSPVFAAMFSIDMKENNENIVSITNIDNNCLRKMLKFMYNGRIDYYDEINCELLIAADQYGVQKLKNICEYKLSTQLTIDTAITTLLIADKHNANRLRYHTMNFIVSNATEIIKTEAFNSLESSHINIVKEILHVIVSKINVGTPKQVPKRTNKIEFAYPKLN